MGRYAEIGAGSAAKRSFLHQFRWVAVMVAVATAVATATITASAGDATADASDVLRAEIDALLAGGLSADDPRVARLQADLAALEQGAQLPQPGEPGLDLTGVLGTEPGSGARSASADAADATAADAVVAWDRGVVECEPLPPDKLTVDEIAGARCVSAPQPDGTSRYVAITPDGTVRVVRFDTDGTVIRTADRHVALPGAGLDGVELTVDGSGHVLVTVSGAPTPGATVDLG
jgi:hypothetical protein